VLSQIVARRSRWSAGHDDGEATAADRPFGRSVLPVYRFAAVWAVVMSVLEKTLSARTWSGRVRVARGHAR
jgi:hypothetical protein